MSGSDLRPKEQSVREARLGTAVILGFPLNHRGDTAPRHAHSKNPKVRDIQAPSPNFCSSGGGGRREDREDSKHSLQSLVLDKGTPGQWVVPFTVQFFPLDTVPSLDQCWITFLPNQASVSHLYNGYCNVCLWAVWRELYNST